MYLSILVNIVVFVASSIGILLELLTCVLIIGTRCAKNTWSNTINITPIANILTMPKIQLKPTPNKHSY
jgi:hypothetical protein